MEISSRKITDLLFLILTLVCFHIHTKAQEDPAYIEIPVGVIVDMGSWVGKSVHSSITMAVSDFYTDNRHYKTRIVIHDRDTHGEPLHALSAALDLLEKPKVQAIIGSESTAEAKFLAVLGDEARVPILSLSSNPTSNKHPYFLQITQDETTQVKAIAAMVESFGWKNVILICEDTYSGRDMVAFMTKSLQEKHIFITYSSLIPVSASSELVHQELHKLSAMQTKVYIMHVMSSLASHLFLNAKHLGMMDAGYKWIITSKTMNFFNFMDNDVIESMQGAVGFRSYIPQSSYLHKFSLKWRKEYDAKEINAYAIWAYDAVSALAMAIERTQSVLELNTNDLETTGRSTQWGTALLNQMLRISFHGLGGDFQFMNGIITAQGLEVLNVLDKREHKVGFWTTDAAFTKKIGKLNSSSDDGLEAIVWTGGILTNPTHRMLQMSSKVLRIGIPVQHRSGGLFQVEYDALNNKSLVSGFCGEVLLASFKELNLSVPYEFIPFINKAEVGTVNYNDLIERVHAGELDAAIGDITITANRSRYVDFTLPFTDLGLATLYRNTDASMWIFMEPLSSDLWVVSACFIILLGFIIWILEHRTNEEFQGSLVQQIGTTFWFAFSTIVYAHRQNLQSNLSRFVVTVWLFVVLVLVSSYTATLSSILTVEQIQLASKKGSIGYQASSPVPGVIVRNLNFKDTRLRPYSSLEEYAEALSRGSKKGGVDAIVDEIPNIKEFLGKYSSGYNMVVSEDITNGFGFVFPLGSPLAPEISRQIAKLREDGTLKILENKWLNPQSKDYAPVQKVLNFKELRGLFFISGGSMASAIFLFMIYFIHEKLSLTNAKLAGGKLAFIMNFLSLTNAKLAGGKLAFIMNFLSFTNAKLAGGKLAFIMNLLVAKTANAIGRS